MSDASNFNPDWTAYIERARDLTQDEMNIREQVVRQYLYDYSWTKACLRCGFRPEFAADNAERFAKDPYCIWRVKELAREIGLNPNPEQRAKDIEQDKVDIINALKKEAHYYGPGSSQAARVSALGKLAQLLGMEPPKQIKADVKGTGVMIVPGIADTDEWEKLAIQQQEDLREDTMRAIEKGDNNVH